MYPPERAFSPKQFYFAFISAVASSLKKGALLLQAAGFVRVYQTAHDFRDSMKALRYSRRMISMHRLKEITYKDIINSRLKESMITFGNIKSIIHLGTIFIISAGAAFIAEICSVAFLPLTPV